MSVARVFDNVGETSGVRILVDRVWPRGISKKELKHDDWIRDVAPSSNLRKWFNHDADKWPEFRCRYLSELKENPEAVERCLEWCRKGNVTLLFAAKDREHNQAVVLRDHLRAARRGGHHLTERRKDSPARFASSPCMAHEVVPDYFDPLAVDPQQARDVARWRRGERTRLRAKRDAMSVADRKAVGTALVAGLSRLLEERFDGVRGRVFSAYWPIKGEPDLRPLMTELHETGVTVALPLVEVKAAPLVFRRWTPETRMVRGDWNIPVPPTEASVVEPDITLAPLLGWDDAGYRLGYGGGYFDRTLGALSPRPATIGIGFQSSQLATIFPQPHDIPLDLILTEAGVQVSGNRG